MIITIEDLNAASQFKATFKVFKENNCWFCSITRTFTPYQYSFFIFDEPLGRRDSSLIVSSCKNHLEECYRLYEKSTIILLSAKDIFYLNCK